MKRRTKNHFAAASAVLLTCATAARGAAGIPITNAGFEDPALPELEYPTTIPHWSQGQYDGSAPTVWIVGTSGAGVYDVSTSDNTSGGTLVSALTVNDGAALGLEVGASVISSGTLTLADGAKVKLTGTPTAQSYTLFQATAINGTPVLDAEIPDYELVVADGGTTLKLNSTAVAPYLFWATGPFAGVLNDTITVDDNFYDANPGIDKVTVAIPRTLANGDKLFTRLNVVVVTP